jgi:hypothetical protein
MADGHEPEKDLPGPRRLIMTIDGTAVVSGSEPVESNARSGIAFLPTPPRIDLKTIDDVRVEMARVYRDMRAGKLETADGTKLAYVLSQLGKLIESGELEKRLEALEGVLISRKVSKK